MMTISLRRFGTGLSVFLLAGTTITKIHAEELVVPCDFGPDEVTNALGTEVPQTCIDVPYDDGTSNVMVSRCFYTYVPPSCVDLDDSVPLVVDVHGHSSCPRDQASLSGWKELADEHCFIVVWPSGQADTNGACFNLPGGLQDSNFTDITTIDCCCTPSPSDHVGNVDDPLFVRMAIDQAVEDAMDAPHTLEIDRSRVYMAGLSNGCMTSLSMAATYPDAIAAVCCHAGAIITPFDIDSTSDKVPVWMVHGTADADLPFEGNSWMWGIPETLEYLAMNNGCSGEDEISNEESTLYRRDECTNGATVELLVLPGVGHVPYKLPPEIAFFVELMMGPTATIDTAKMAWDFCSSHTKAFTPGPLAAVTGGGEEEETDPAGEEINPAENGSQDGEDHGGSDDTTTTDEESAAARSFSQGIAVLHVLLVVVSSFVSNCL